MCAIKLEESGTTPPLSRIFCRSKFHIVTESMLALLTTQQASESEGGSVKARRDLNGGAGSQRRWEASASK